MLAHAREVEMEDGSKSTVVDEEGQLVCLNRNLDMLREMNIEDIVNIDRF